MQLQDGKKSGYIYIFLIGLNFPSIQYYWYLMQYSHTTTYELNIKATIKINIALKYLFLP